MRALQLQGKNQFEVVDIVTPEPAEGWVLVRTGATTICTSDLNDLHGNPFHIALPMTMGHEGAGTVAALGAGVQGLEPGDRVAAHPVHPCGRCPVCLNGLAHLCPNMTHFGLSMPGTMAEYFLVREDRVRRLPPGTDLSLAALVEPHGPFIFPASHYVNISDYQAEKGRLLLNHRSQEEAMRLATGSGLEEMSRRLDGYRGEQVGCAYAECFVPMRARGAFKPFAVLP